MNDNTKQTSTDADNSEEGQEKVTATEIKIEVGLKSLRRKKRRIAPVSAVVPVPNLNRPQAPFGWFLL